ncbi:MAG: helix-turn-helix domain-containing protein [Anaerostipes sp.]|jgi:transcriptional regulator with XRE-family HTH domain
MTMGEYIKQLREEKELSQDALGQLLNPPVNRAAVNKWEKNLVQNIKRTHIQQLANLFGVSPCELMRFDDEFNEDGKVTKGVELIEQIQESFGKDAVRMLEYFTKLNSAGKEKAMQDLIDIAEISRYTD